MDTSETQVGHAVATPPGLGDSAPGHAAAMERRRRRLLLLSGLDPGNKMQAEIPLDFAYWRPIRWRIECRWKPHVAKELCPGSNPWYAHPAFLSCTTERVVVNACAVLRKQFPGKSYRWRAAQWVDKNGIRYPNAI